MTATFGGVLFAVIGVVLAGALVWILGFIISAMVSFIVAVVKDIGDHTHVHRTPVGTTGEPVLHG